MSVYSLSLSFLWSICSKKYMKIIWTWKALFHNTTCIKSNFHQKSFIYLHVFQNNCKSNRFYITDSNSFKITDLIRNDCVIVCLLAIKFDLQLWLPQIMFWCIQFIVWMILFIAGLARGYRLHRSESFICIEIK